MLQALTMGHTPLFIHGDDVSASLEHLVELMRIQVKWQVANEDNLFHSTFESSRRSGSAVHVAVNSTEMQSREVAAGRLQQEKQQIENRLGTR